MRKFKSLQAFRFRSAALLSLFSAFVCAPASAGVICELTNFTVDAYHHSGVYVHGDFPGYTASHINLCGIDEQTAEQDCNNDATNRRLAIALAAQAQGKPLLLFFDALNSCDVAPYTIATSVRAPPG